MPADERREPSADSELEELHVPLDDEGGEALASAVLALPHTPWLTLLDAYVERGRVVVVLPATDRSLGEALRDGLDRDVAEVLLWSFDETLDLLDEQGLAPATLDPDALGLTAGGDVLLLPVVGPTSTEVERDGARLLSWLQTPPEGQPDPARDDRDLPGDGRTPQRTSEVVAGGSAVRPQEPAALDPVPTADEDADLLDGRAGGTRWGRTVLLSALVAVAVLVTGLLLSDRQPASDPGPVAAAPVQTDVDDALGPEGLDALVQDLTEDPALRQEAGRTLLQQLQKVQASEGSQRAAAAAAVLQTVAVTPPQDAVTARRIRSVVRPIAQPADLPGLIALVQVDPDSHGRAGRDVLARLQALQALPASELARTQAQDLAAFIATQAVLGELTPTFADIAEDVLRPLAQPADLAALLAAVRVQPERFGPGTPALVSRLEGLQRLQGAAARSEATALLSAIDAEVAGGRVSRAFQDIAEPVLRPIATATATGDAT